MKVNIEVMNTRQESLRKAVLCTLIACALLCVASTVWAAAVNCAMPKGTLAYAACSIRSNLGEVAKVVVAGAYIAGFGFAFGAILKFKAHKDAPTQVPVGTPIAMLFMAAALIFLPTLFTTAGKTIFGSGAKSGGLNGSFTSLPVQQ